MDVGFSGASSGGTSDVSGKRRILVIATDKNISHLVKVLLEKTGSYVVSEENDSTNAYQSARNFKPDLILFDVVMPIRDGSGIESQLRRDPELQNTPIIFLSALVTPAEANAGVQIDGHSFVAKPINIQELVDVIEERLPVRAKSYG